MPQIKHFITGPRSPSEKLDLGRGVPGQYGFGPRSSFALLVLASASCHYEGYNDKLRDNDNIHSDNLTYLVQNW